MIRELNDTNDLDAVIRQFLIRQSQLEPRFVRNSKSVFGSDLDKSDDNVVFKSIDQDDVTILFSVYDRQSDSDMTETNSDGSIAVYKSFVIHVIVYGNKSGMMANKLVARFRTLKVRSDLQENAIHLETISDITELQDFKASTIWERNDFDINISCRLAFDQVDDDYDIESLTSLIIDEA